MGGLHELPPWPTTVCRSCQARADDILGPRRAHALPFIAELTSGRERLRERGVDPEKAMDKDRKYKLDAEIIRAEYRRFWMYG